MNTLMQTTTGSNKIKILLFTGSLESGGAERFTVFLCNHLPRERFDIVLVVFSLKERVFTVADYVRIINLNKGYKTSLPHILRVIRMEKPQLIFCTLTIVNVMMAVARFFFSVNIPVIARESSIMSNMIHHFPSPRMIKWVVKKTYPRFTRMVAQSMAMKEDLVDAFGLPAEKVVQIYNPVDEQPLKPVRPVSAVLQLITVGNVRKEKGHDRIIRALALLNIDFHYTIVGGGVPEEIEKVKTTIATLGLEQKVTLTGAQQNPFAYMNQADVFLQGSYFEGFPNSLLEANAIGLPIVAYACPGGTAEIVEEGMNGFLVKEQTAAAFAAVIEKAATYSFDAAAIRQRILTKFDKANILQTYTALFEEIVSEKSKR